MKKSFVMASLVAASTSMMAMDLQYFLGAGATRVNADYKGTIAVPSVGYSESFSDDMSDTGLTLKTGVILDKSHRISLSYSKFSGEDTDVKVILGNYDYLIPINKEFKHFAMDSGFEVITCKPYRPKTKGKVESLAKLVDRLKTYNEEFNDFNQLELIVKEFNDDINNEISQATNEKPISRFQKEKEHLNPLPNMDNLMSYFHHEKEFKVSNESMIKYKGKKYSVPTRYIGKKVNVFCSDDKLQIYYTKDLIACHTVSDKILHYKSSHAREILKSEALKTYSDDEIDIFIHENLFKMDIFLEE